MCSQSEDYSDMSASRVRNVHLRAQDVGEVLHILLLGQRTSPLWEDRESISNNMVGTKSVLAWNNQETWGWCLTIGEIKDNRTKDVPGA